MPLLLRRTASGLLVAAALGGGLVGCNSGDKAKDAGDKARDAVDDATGGGG